MPADGMEADVCGRIGLYSKKGQFRLDVERLETTGGDGLWSVARERLTAQLRGEGLLDEARKRPLPMYPERIGLVTSGKGAALQDMWRVMRRRAWWIRVLVSAYSDEAVQQFRRKASSGSGAKHPRIPVEGVRSRSEATLG